MKCDQCRVLLEEYFDQALDGKQSSTVSAHLQTCNQCAEEYSQMLREQQRYQRYERDVEVTPALWTAIAARIDEHRAQQKKRPMHLVRAWLSGFGGMRLSPALVAALVVLAVGATVVVTRILERTPPSISAPPAPGNQVAVAKNGDKSGAGGTDDSGKQRAPGSPSDSTIIASQPTPASGATNRIPIRRKPSTAELIREAEQKYLTAIAILSRDADRRKPALEPAALAKFETALAIIDNTIDETRRAARKNPNDPIALQYLLASYSKKVDVLREMARE